MGSVNEINPKAWLAEMMVIEATNLVNRVCLPWLRYAAKPTQNQAQAKPPKMVAQAKNGPSTCDSARPAQGKPVNN